MICSMCGEDIYDGEVFCDPDPKFADSLTNVLGKCGNCYRPVVATKKDYRPGAVVWNFERNER